ncbi:MAG: beta-xylosidase, partial [Candidatus Sulfotelmatobacter sp.]
QDADVPGPAADVQLQLAGLPGKTGRVLLRHYRVDGEHSNSYTAWKAIGSPQKPTPEQQAKLEAAGQLQLLDSPRWMNAREGKANVQFSLPLQGISLVTVTW